MDEEMKSALEKDGEFLRQMTGQDHGPVFIADKRGATLGFAEGLLQLRLSGYGAEDGSGSLSFKEDDLQWGDGEDSHWRFMRLPKSELEAIRDFLNKHLPEVR